MGSWQGNCEVAQTGHLEIIGKDVDFPVPNPIHDAGTVAWKLQSLAK
jgi:hypothetical protein